jgi:hypothetical protein
MVDKFDVELHKLHTSAEKFHAVVDLLKQIVTGSCLLFAIKLILDGFSS